MLNKENDIFREKMKHFSRVGHFWVQTELLGRVWMQNEHPAGPMRYSGGADQIIRRAEELDSIIIYQCGKAAKCGDRTAI